MSIFGHSLFVLVVFDLVPTVFTYIRYPSPFPKWIRRQEQDIPGAVFDTITCLR